MLGADDAVHVFNIHLGTAFVERRHQGRRLSDRDSGILHDRALTTYITGTYHGRVHGETKVTPLEAWRGTGFLPRLPESLEELDLLLVMHAKPRVVRRDGIRFPGTRISTPHPETS